MENNQSLNKDKKHDLKRKRIQLSLYGPDQRKMIKKYGKILSANEALEILLESQFTTRVIEINKTPLNADIHNQLKKIGNNINQIAFIANAKKDIPTEIRLLEELNELKKLTREIRNLL